MILKSLKDKILEKIAPNVAKDWNVILNEQSPLLQTVLKYASWECYTKEVIRFTFLDEFHRKIAESRITSLQNYLEKRYGRKFSIELLLENEKETIKEELKLTKQEIAFLTLLDPDCYIARVNTNDIFIYNAKPIKQDGCWVSFKNEVIASVFLNANQFILFRDTFFPFIRSEDEEPWKVEDLLQLEVEDENDMQS